MADRMLQTCSRRLRVASRRLCLRECAEPVGACCIGTNCSQTTQAACIQAGGVWQGAGVPCTPNPCVVVASCCCPTQPVPPGISFPQPNAHGWPQGNCPPASVSIRLSGNTTWQQQISQVPAGIPGTVPAGIIALNGNRQASWDQVVVHNSPGCQPTANIGVPFVPPFPGPTVLGGMTIAFHLGNGLSGTLLSLPFEPCPSGSTTIGTLNLSPGAQAVTVTVNAPLTGGNMRYRTGTAPAWNAQLGDCWPPAPPPALVFSPSDFYLVQQSFNPSLGWPNGQIGYTFVKHLRYFHVYLDGFGVWQQLALGDRIVTASGTGQIVNPLLVPCGAESAMPLDPRISALTPEANMPCKGCG